MPASNNAPTLPIATPPAAGDLLESLIRRVRSLIARGQVNAASLLLPTLEKMGAGRDAICIIGAEIALHRGNKADAAALIDAGLTRMPHNASLLVLRARLSLDDRDLVGAALVAAEAITADPTNAQAKSVLGQALLDLGQIEQAATCLGEAFNDLPNDGPTLSALTRADPAGAVVAIRSLVAGGNDNVANRNALIAALLASKDIEAATCEIKNLTVSGRADPHTGLLAVQAAIDAENWTEATFLFNRATGHLPRHA